MSTRSKFQSDEIHPRGTEDSPRTLYRRQSCTPPPNKSGRWLFERICVDHFEEDPFVTRKPLGENALPPGFVHKLHRPSTTLVLTELVAPPGSSLTDGYPRPSRGAARLGSARLPVMIHTIVSTATCLPSRFPYYNVRTLCLETFMATATPTEGQITIPAEVRAALEWMPDRVSFSSCAWR